MTHRSTSTRCSLAVALLPVCALAQSKPLEPSSAPECATCHVEWADAFDRDDAVVLLERPTDAVAAEGRTCLGCHDGSVADSRREVWLDHGHQSGVSPPPTMRIPPNLPLADGKINCGTCHTAHARIDPEARPGAVPLRVRNDDGQLCRMCHRNHEKGSEPGTHPVDGMPWPIPDALVAAGAGSGPHPQRLTCMSCHTAHGRREEHLLVTGDRGSRLCLTCHAKLQPETWDADATHEHPQNPRLTVASHLDAIRDLGTTTGPGDTLTCLSCHKMHRAEAGEMLLAETLHDSGLCVRCHPGREGLFGTAHDLRASAPDERNLQDRTARDAGPCGACHSAHQHARRSDPQPLDPAGSCATCHNAGQCASNMTGWPFSHTVEVDVSRLEGEAGKTLLSHLGGDPKKELLCVTCHDPHETRHAHFLRHEPDALCASCHADQSVSLAGAHDFTNHPDVENGLDRTCAETGKCGFCHSVHRGNGSSLWVATKEVPRQPDELCTQCHRTDGLAADMPGAALLHPAGPETAAPTEAMACKLPLFDAAGNRADNGFVACSSCHDPHGGSDGRPHLLRDEGGGGLCVQCHTEADSIRMSLHSEAELRGRADAKQWARSSASCGPCHGMHAREGVASVGTWLGPLGPSAHPVDVRRCTGCHGPGGGAIQVTPVDHPLVGSPDVGDLRTGASLPLAHDGDSLDEGGRITCVTCHLPHGRIPETVPPLTAPDMISRDQRRARMVMLRPFRAPNLCTACHGFDGLRRFLYYHDPDERGPWVQMLMP